MAKKGGTNRTLDILNSIGEQDFLDDRMMQNLRANGLRVENIALSLIRPDPAQPRRVLPEIVHQSFHNGEITPVQALKQYVNKIRILAKQKGRPFENLLDLLNLESEDEEPGQLTQPEQGLRDLVNLALTLKNDGQVNPLTIVDVTEGVTPSYLIETGERRYWASYINMEFIPAYEGDGTIPCIILPDGQASVFRQAKENTSRAGLNAIGMARQAALLILAVHDIHPPLGAVGNDFYRQVLELDLRSKREYTTEILLAMGGITRGRLSHYKRLLTLSDEAIELADRYSIDEGRLRHIARLPTDVQAMALEQVINHDLDIRQIKKMLDETTPDEQPPPVKAISRGTRRTLKLIESDELLNIQELEQVLRESDEDSYRIRRKVQRVREALEELESRFGG
jgi:hypothetical protein